MFKQDNIPAKRLIEKEKLIKGKAILFYNNTAATAAMAAAIIATEPAFTTITF